MKLRVVSAILYCFLLSKCKSVVFTNSTYNQDPIDASYSTMTKRNEQEAKEFMNMLLDVLKNVSSSVLDIVEEVKQKNREKRPQDSMCLHMEADILLKKDPEDCETLLKMGNNESGLYVIYPRYLNHPLQVYCDMKTDGGGWIVFQRRGKFASLPRNFYETWESYKNGFGNLTEEFWLGNEALFALTHQIRSTLRVDMKDFYNGSHFASYRDFVVRGEIEEYRMTIGKYHGNAGDSLRRHNNMTFVTKESKSRCPKDYYGGWWYQDCYDANLNGLYLDSKNNSRYRGIVWKEIHKSHYNLKSTEMKIRSY